MTLSMSLVVCIPISSMTHTAVVVVMSGSIVLQVYESIMVIAEEVRTIINLEEMKPLPMDNVEMADSQECLNSLHYFLNRT